MLKELLLILVSIVNFNVYSMNIQLMNAVRNGNIVAIKNLVNEAEDINAKTLNGYSPLHWAVYYRRGDIVKLLLEQGADTNVRDFSGNTPLYWAAFKGYKYILELLLEAGADKTIENSKNEKAADIAKKPKLKEILNNYMQVFKR